MTSVSSQASIDQTSRENDAVAHRATRGSLVAALWTLYVLTLRQHLHGKRWMVMGLLFLLPAGLAVLMRVTSPDVPAPALEFFLVWIFIPQALLPLVALLYASGIIQDEQEEQTITYLLVRPIPKWALYLVKLLATFTTTVILTAIFTGLTFAAIYFGENAPPYGGQNLAGESIPLRSLKTIAIQALAVISYCSLFGLMSLVTKRILVVGILYIAVVEGVLANFPFGIRLVTVIYYSRLVAYRTLTFMVPTPGGGTMQDVAAEAWQLDVRADPGLLEHPQFGMCIKVLLTSSAVCAIVAAWICSRREFHFKTPEKD